MRKKLQHFAELLTFPNYREFPKKRDDWVSFFPKQQPLVLELGCGKGEYTLALARAFPDKNFIGIDRKGARLWRGCKTALEEGLTNVLFIRSDIQNLKEFLKPGDVAEIWITFPDPFPKEKHEKHRLTHPQFLSIYQQLLTPAGLVHLKTDDLSFFLYTTQTIKQIHGTILESIEDIYSKLPSTNILTQVQTFYEQQHLKNGRKINYLKFRLPLKKIELF